MPSGHPAQTMTTAAHICLASSALFLLAGLLTGVWKYVCMATSPDATAPVYVDIAHRTALMYSFACLVMHQMVPYSPVDASWTRWVVGIPIGFFALAVASYVLHGMLRDTDNQLRTPHRLGPMTLPKLAMQGLMVSLIIGEIGGVGILVYGVLTSH